MLISQGVPPLGGVK